VGDRVLAQLRDILAPEFRRAALDTSLTPWRMSFPAATGPWRQVEAELGHALRARPVTPDEEAVRTLVVSEMTVDGDSARGDLRLRDASLHGSRAS